MQNNANGLCFEMNRKTVDQENQYCDQCDAWMPNFKKTLSKRQSFYCETLRKLSRWGLFVPSLRILSWRRLILSHFKDFSFYWRRSLIHDFLINSCNQTSTWQWTHILRPETRKYSCWLRRKPLTCWFWSHQNYEQRSQWIRHDVLWIPWILISRDAFMSKLILDDWHLFIRCCSLWVCHWMSTFLFRRLRQDVWRNSYFSNQSRRLFACFWRLLRSDQWFTWKGSS